MGGSFASPSGTDQPAADPPAAASTEATTAHARPTPDGAATTAAPTHAPAPVVSGAAAMSPPAARQPAEGTYSYTEDINGGADQSASLTVFDDGATTTATLADVDGQQTEEATWSATARTLLATTSDGQRCAWSPAAVTLPLPLRDGQTWSATSQCTVHIGHGSTAVVQQVEDSAVKGYGTVHIGGDAVVVWAITRHTTVTETTTTKAGKDVAHAESQRTELFAPALGIDVQVTEQSVAPNGAGGSSTTYSILRLTSARPQTG